MAQFPTSISSFTGFTSSHTLSQDSHASQHNSEQAEITATQTKIGTGNSTPTSGMLLRGTGAGTSSWAQANLTTDVTGVLPIANGGTGASSASGALVNLGAITLQQIYPIGCIYTEITGVNPNITFGFGTWSSFGTGQTLVGVDVAQTEFNTVQKAGGEKVHTLITSEIPSHNHTQDAHSHPPGGGGSSFVQAGGGAGAAIPITGASYNTASTTGNTTATNQSTGGDGTHNNLQPYLTVFFWRRTA